MLQAIRAFFDLDGRRTTFAREARGALATFLTMSYILFVNWAVLKGALAKDGVTAEAVITATALAAGACCLLMGLLSNFPVALASGMGLNAVVAGLIASGRVSWQVGMGLVVLDGLLVLLMVLAGLREAMLRAIPRDLRLAIGSGIGLFIAFIGLVNARLVVVPDDTLFVLTKVSREAALPPVTFGSLREPGAAVALVGLLLTAVLLAWRVPGAILLGILGSTLLAVPFGLVEWKGLTWPSFATVGQADVWGALRWELLPFLLALVMVDFFDTLGTVSGLAEQAGLYGPDGSIPRLRSILAVDAVSASVGGFCGCSSVTAYVESAAGVAEGARTGLHTVVVGLLFLAAIFAAPFAGLVPAAATAPALIVVGFLMAQQAAGIDFRDVETALPAFLTLITIPLTYSIAHGVGYGFIAYAVLKVGRGKWGEVHPILYAAAGLFAAYFVWGQA